MEKQQKQNLWHKQRCIGTHDADYVFKTFDEFLRVASDGKNPCIPHQIGTNILMNWNWMVSVNKARKENVEYVMEFFDELENDDDYKNGEYGDPCAKDDKRCWIHYKDRDYLVIIMHQIDNGFHPYVYKIGVTDADEEKVKECLVTMKKYMNEEIFRV